MLKIPAFPEIGIVVVLFCISLATIIVLYGPKTRASRYFTISNILSGIWILVNTVLLPLKLHDLNLLVNLSFASANATFIAIWKFTLNYTPDQIYKHQKVIDRIVSYTGAFTTLLSLVTSLVILRTYYIDDSLTLEFGPLYPIYISYFVGVFILIILNLNRKLKISANEIKPQLKLFRTGFIMTASISLGSNLILPFLTGDSNSSRIGPLGMVFFLGMTSYAILRHRFLDIRVLIGRITYYLTVAAFPFIAFFFLAWLYIQLFGSVFSPEVYLISPFVAISFVIAFNFINNYIRTQVNSRLINPGYDPLTTVEKLSSELSLIIDLPTIAQRINEVIQRTIRPEYEAILVFPQYDESGNKTADFRAFHSQNNQIPVPDKFMTIVSTIWQSLGRYPIVFDELEEEMTRGAFRNIPNLIKDLQPLMQQINAKVILSIGDKENIKGMFVVGPKEADYPYSSQDIDFLKSIANSGGLAIERSLLYGEVQEFANTLQGKVDQATSDLKQANTDLQAALEQLQEARRQERDMMDVMGHELRTPITIVRNALSMMSRERDKTGGNISPEHLNKYLDMAIESIRREITLIETLLSATKIDGARMQIYSTKVDFKDVVNDAIEGQKTIAAQKGIQINYAAPAIQIFVYSDRTRVQEVMDNFLSNAVKYTMKGAVNIDIWQDEKYGWISVKDSGIGISAEDLQNLGKKFFRAKQYVGNNDADSGGKVVRPGGTGLGLYVTFDLIKVMGGELYINSKVGEGSAFTFSMPLYTGQPDQQFDQTFDDQKKTVERSHIHLNEELPKKS